MQMVISNVYTMLHTNLMNKRYLNIIGGLNNIRICNLKATAIFFG